MSFYLWGSGFVLLKRESCYYDRGWWTNQKFEVVSYFFFFWEQTSSTVIGILTLRLFQCNYFQENIFTFYNVCFVVKYIVKGKYFQSAKSI